MSTIEPTEEQWQAAFAISDRHPWRAVCSAKGVAQLLAAREAKLSKAHEDFFFKSQSDWIDENYALKAEIADLKKKLKEKGATE